MKPFLIAALIALLPSSLFAEQIQVDAKFIYGNARHGLVHDFPKLERGKGRIGDFIAPPPATTRSGRNVEFDIAPADSARAKYNHWNLSVTPRLTTGGVAFTAHLSYQEEPRAGLAGQPSVSGYGRSELRASGTRKIGEELWLDLPPISGVPRAVRIVFTVKRA